MARQTYSGFDALGKLYGIKPQDTPKSGGGNRNDRGGGFRNERGNKPPVTTTATAPYNFVSLPGAALASPMNAMREKLLLDNNQDAFREYIESGEQLGGEIRLDITALTPLFIGGNVVDAARNFAPVDIPILPGSSLRGMFKNIFKIVTLGAFRGRTSTLKKGEDLTDEHIYFRCLMTTKSSPPWMSVLNDLYNNRMITTVKNKDGKSVPAKNAHPGFLIKTRDGKFWIAPAMKKLERILIKEYERKFKDRLAIRGSRVTWLRREAYIITGSQPPFKLHDAKSYEKLNDDQKKKAGKQFIRFTSIDAVDWSREHWTELDDEVRSSYEHDRNRRGVNLFKDKGVLDRQKLQSMVKNLPADVLSLVPCHFLVEDGRITAFGHGQCFRIPYRHRIGALIPQSLNSDAIDFADALFGRESFWAGRVFFEDAKPLGELETLSTAAAHPQMQPNPTSYQLYLKQDSAKLKHWDSDGAQLRGYKMYWHRRIADWKASDEEIALDKDKPSDKKLTREITPLRQNSRFQSKIRFRNLNAIELGALLMIFDLNGATNAAYKLGKGKPFGFGSIKVESQLFLEDASTYFDPIEDDGWREPLRAADAKKYLDDFRNYIRSNKLQAEWQNVMKELNAVLNWEQTKQKGWNEKIASMSGNVMEKDSVDQRFKDRAPLPSIFEVVR